MSRWEEWRYHMDCMKKKQAERGIDPCEECIHCIHYGLFEPDLFPDIDACLGAEEPCKKYEDEREDY